MSNIDKVKLYPFSPLKLLHETRKLTASQAKFFVALMCLYFERQGYLGWLYRLDGECANFEEAEEKNAAEYAPYCGVTKKTFIKMIKALKAVEVVYLDEEGCITPVIAKEIQEAIKHGTHQINELDEYGQITPVTPVATALKNKEGVAAVAEDTFQENAEIASRGVQQMVGGRGENGLGHVGEEENTTNDALTGSTSQYKDWERAMNMDWEEKGMSLSERREEILGKVEEIKRLTTEQGEERIQYEDFRPLVIAKRTVFETRQFVRDDLRLMDLLKPLFKARDDEHRKFYGDEFEDDWVSPDVWEKMPSVLDGINIFEHF